MGKHRGISSISRGSEIVKLQDMQHFLTPVLTNVNGNNQINSPLIQDHMSKQLTNEIIGYGGKDEITTDILSQDTGFYS